MARNLKEIIWFHDIGTWMRCEVEAKIKGAPSLKVFIVSCVNDYLSKKGIDIDFTSAKQFYTACRKQAQLENSTVPAIIEKACAEAIGQTAQIATSGERKPGKWWELPKG